MTCRPNVWWTQTELKFHRYYRHGLVGCMWMYLYSYWDLNKLAPTLTTFRCPLLRGTPGENGNNRGERVISNIHIINLLKERSPYFSEKMLYKPNKDSAMKNRAVYNTVCYALYIKKQGMYSSHFNNNKSKVGFLNILTTFFLPNFVISNCDLVSLPLPSPLGSCSKGRVMHPPKPHSTNHTP